MTTNFLEEPENLSNFQYLLPEQKTMIKKLIDFSYQENQNNPNNSPSFLEDAAEFIGCIDDGPGDLATNKKYLEGFGQE